MDRTLQEYVVQGSVSQNQDDQQNQLTEFRKNLETYGKISKIDKDIVIYFDEKNIKKVRKMYKSNEGLQILSVKDYYKQRDEHLNQTVLNDIDSLKHEYVKRGGMNSEFLNNLQDMEKYFQGKHHYKNLINNPNALQIQRAIEPSSSYAHPIISQGNLIDSFSNELANFHMLTNQTQYSIPPSERKSGLNESNIAGLRSEQEQVYDQLNLQESQLLLELSSLHQNSYEFQLKKDQYSKIRVLKNEIEKNNLHNRLNQSINSLQSQQPMLLPNMNSSMIDQLEQSDYFPQKNGAYVFQEGFILRFDYISLIPSNFDQVQINFGVYRKGQSLDTYLKSDIYQSEYATQLSSKVILTEKKQIHKVQPHIDSILYFEMYSNEKDPKKRALAKRAWTMHEIFDPQSNLNCGKFKLPFYNRNFNPQLLTQTGLPQMADSSLYIRICYKDDPNLDHNSFVFIENEYKVPYLHLRQQMDIETKPKPIQVQPQFLAMKEEYAAIQREKEEEEMSRLLNMQDEFDAVYDSKVVIQKLPKNPNKIEDILEKYQQQQQLIKQQQLQLSELQDQLQDHQQLKQQQEQSESQIQQLQQQVQSQSSNLLQVPKQSYQKKQTTLKIPTQSDQPDSQKELSQSSFYKQSKSNMQSSKQIDDNNLTDGVVVKLLKIDGLKNIYDDAQINVKLYDGNNIMKDSNGEECDLTFDIDLDDRENVIDKEKIFEIKIKEILKTYKKLQLDKVFLFINITHDNQPIAWLVTPLFKTSLSKQDINNGKFIENLNKTPVKKPPFFRINPKSDMTIEYTIHDPDLLESELQEFNLLKGNKTETTIKRAPTVKLTRTATSVPQKSPEQAPQKSPGLDPQKQPGSDPQQPEQVQGDSNNPMINGLIIPQVEKVDKVDGPRNILFIEMETLNNYKNNWSISYDLVILKPQEIVSDEFGNPAVYHFDELIPPNDNSNIVEFKTFIKVPVDLEIIQKKKAANWDQAHIIFKFVEVDDGDEEKTLGWLAHPLYKYRKINQGAFSELLYELPLQINLPLVRTNIKKRKEKLNYKISVKNLPADEFNQLKNMNLENIAGLSDQEKEQKTVFTVVIHDLKNLEKTLLLNDDFMSDVKNEQCTYQGDLKEAVKNTISFMEEYNFEVDIKKIQEEYKDKLNNIHLVLYLLNKAREPKYWFYCRLFDVNGKPHIGTFESKIFLTPIQKMTQINLKKIKESKAVMKYSFSEGYQNDDLDSKMSPN